MDQLPEGQPLIFTVALGVTLLNFLVQLATRKTLTISPQNILTFSSSGGDKKNSESSLAGLADKLNYFFSLDHIHTGNKCRRAGRVGRSQEHPGDNVHATDNGQQLC